MKQQNVKTGGLKVRTGLASGYWTCTGVQGASNRQGYYYNYPHASLCYKPKYAPIFGAPAAPGGGDD